MVKLNDTNPTIMRTNLFFSSEMQDNQESGDLRLTFIIGQATLLVPRHPVAPLRRSVIFAPMTGITLLSPAHWRDYALLDCGDFEKLERFGPYVLRRPEPQALWSRALPEADWQRQAHAQFVQEGSHSGQWLRRQEMPDQWFVSYRQGGMSLKFRLGLTGFKHVGLFPEQAVNWDFIYQQCRQMQQPKVLNLFAYTGGASLAARAAGADVTHCDAIRQVVNWAKANMEASAQDGIRWLIEDAFKFVQREARRGNRYQGIILDPPSWGHGPKGEKWKLEDMINELCAGLAQILDPEQRFLVFNSYSLGYSPLVLYDLMLAHFGKAAAGAADIGEIFLPDEHGRKLPAGVFFRMGLKKG